MVKIENLEIMSNVRKRVKGYVDTNGTIGLQRYIEREIGADEVSVITTKNNKVLVSYIYKDIPSTEIYDLPVEFIVDELNDKINRLDLIVKVGLPIVTIGIVSAMLFL